MSKLLVMKILPPLKKLVNALGVGEGAPRGVPRLTMLPAPPYQVLPAVTWTLPVTLTALVESIS
jgi:hypothetical protein